MGCGPPTRPPCTTSTWSSRTGRGGGYPRACATGHRPAPWACPGRGRSGTTSPPGWNWAAGGTGSSLPSPTGCWARRWPPCASVACSTRPWWWSRPTTASASPRARRPASSATATTPGSCGCRCSSRSPASTPPRSTTATGSTSTCCPPWPTTPACACPGRWTAARPCGAGRGPRRPSGSWSSASRARPGSSPSTAPRTWPPPWRGAGCRRTRRCARSSAPSPGGAWSGSAPGPTWSAGPSTASR
jgi:hypothetical protein